MCNCNIVAASHITHALHVRCISNKVACRYSRIRGADKHHQDSRGAENGGDRKGTGTRTAQRQPAYARPACFMFRHTQRPPLRYIYIFSSQNLSTPSRQSYVEFRYHKWYPDLLQTLAALTFYSHLIKQCLQLATSYTNIVSYSFHS